VRGDEIDYIARIAEAWDGRGSNAFTPPTEHRLLLKAAGLPDSLWERSWSALAADQRMALVWTVYRVNELRRCVAHIFGEGEGASTWD